MTNDVEKLNEYLWAIFFFFFLIQNYLNIHILKNQDNSDLWIIIIRRYLAAFQLISLEMWYIKI